MKQIHSNDADSVARDLEQFVRERFQIANDESGFSRNVNLWEEGYVDSLGVVEMVSFLERQFQVTLPQEAVFSPDFTSIDGIARYVISLRVA